MVKGKKVDCAHYVWYHRDKMLTDSFCCECPEYSRCNGRLDELALKRMMLEDGWKLVFLV